MMKKLFFLTVLFATFIYSQKSDEQFSGTNIEFSDSFSETNKEDFSENYKSIGFDGKISGDDSLFNDELQDTMYCLIRDRNEYGDYKGTRAQFSVWKPNSGFSCCVIVNISKGNKIIARQRVTVTNSKMLRVLIGEVDGVTQGVSPCN